MNENQINYNQSETHTHSSSLLLHFSPAADTQHLPRRTPGPDSLSAPLCVSADSGALALRFAGIHHANPRHTVSRRGFTAYPGTPSAAV